ncbi:MAG: glycosyltransferase [Verrucomicrobia bacterium]|nr:glycosyltransferase [Verrucomicrobiota bacterium]
MENLKVKYERRDRKSFHGDALNRATRILFVTRPPVEILPPTLHQANILAEEGFRVSIACCRKPGLQNAAAGLNSAIERFSLGENFGVRRPLSARMLEVWRLHRRVRRLVRGLHPGVVIASDADAALAVGNSAGRNGAKLVWHFHHIPEDHSESWSVALANRYVYRNAKLPDLITNCDKSRAEVFAQKAGIDPEKTLIVPNCTRPILRLPEPTLRKTLAHAIPENSGIVLYHGWVGPTHGLELAIRSMPQWPNNSFFVIKGKAGPEYAEGLKQMALKLGVAGRVIFHNPGFQSFEEHYATIAGADLGWTVFEPVNINWKYQAMGSNKRFECMALGLPQIADRNPGAVEFIEGEGFGLCIPWDSVEGAAAAVHRLLDDKTLHKRMAEHGRRLHLERYNYDEQYRPVVRRLRSMLGGNQP